ncbi:MAG: hypothetical protein RLZZ282_836 [Verrucomicrobiota bacterium]|jgi:rare lipoprotein A
MKLTPNYKSAALAIAGVIIFPSCATTAKLHSQFAKRDSVLSVQHGKASWYSIRTNFGTRTASGKRLTNEASTAAHKTLPLGTKVLVTNETNGKSEIVTIIDRGPFVRDRIIDLTIGCAERLGFRHRGVAPVKVEVLGHLKPRR